MRNKPHTGFNRVIREKIFWNISLALILFIYGLYSVIKGDMGFPTYGGRYYKSFTAKLHLHDLPLWLMFLAFLFAIVNLLSIVIDHFDKRENKFNYKRLALISQIIGWTLCISALTVHLAQSLK